MNKVLMCHCEERSDVAISRDKHGRSFTSFRMTGVFLLLSLFLIIACEHNPKKPGFELLPDMAHAVPYESYAANPNTADGKTLQLPAPGSIPRGSLPYHYGNTEPANPFSKTAENLARGKKVYETFCLICHGAGGKGDGPLIPKFPNPPSFTSGAVRDYSEGRIFHVVTRGFGMMASYASQISPEDRWKLVQYVRELQGGSQ